MSVCWVNGRLVELGAPAIAANDHGLLVGDGVFETLKVIDGVPFALTRHLRRLVRSAEAMGISAPDDAVVRDAVAEVLEVNQVDSARLRITLTSGVGPLASTPGSEPPTLAVAVAPLAGWAPTTDAAVVPWTRNEHGALAGVKAVSYGENVVALRYAHQRGADEALFANTAGHLCEGTGSNVFVVIDAVLVTPPLSSGCLAGITRELVCERVPVVERSIDIGELARVSEGFLTSSTRDVHPLRRIDEVVFAAAPGPVTTEVMAAWSRFTADLDP
jgi:branched-chain amino acid aminotransferase